MFTDRVETFLPPRKGREHALRVLRDLLAVSPEGRGTRIGRVLEYLQRVVTKRAVVFLISDFLSGDFTQPLRVAARKHDLIALTVTDPREDDLPPIGLLDLEDAETGERVLVDASDRNTRALFRGWAEGRRAEREALFRSVGVDALEMFTDRPYDLPLLRFFHRRARRMAR